MTRSFIVFLIVLILCILACVIAGVVLAGIAWFVFELMQAWLVIMAVSS
ncbi:hypothetical protein RQN30_10665 [Arcanobacterium hippocoleae]